MVIITIPAGLVPVHAIPQVEFIGIVGDFSGDGALNNPDSVAVNSTGNIFVSDTDNHRVKVFDENGVYTSLTWRVGPDDSNNRGIAIGPLGNVYVVNTNHNDFRIYDPVGNTMGTFNTINSNDIAVDASGSVYITEQDQHRIAVFEVLVKNSDQDHQNLTAGFVT